MAYHSQSRKTVVKELDVDFKTGLSEEQVIERRAKFGPNKLADKKKKNMFVRFLEQFKDVMIIILIIAAIISFVVACIEKDLMEFIEPALILLIVILNA